jgi:beta-lactamase class A
MPSRSGYHRALGAFGAAGLVLVGLAGCAEPSGGPTPSAVVTSASTPTELPSAGPSSESVDLDAAFAQLEQDFDARLGVYAVDTGSERSVAFRVDERFAYASTHKALAVGVLLQQSALADLDRVIDYSSDDLVSYSPITEPRVGSGMTLRELSDASIRYSDNTAGNLVLAEIGGPAGFESALAAIGDDDTQADRIEPDLNEATPGDTRDTSTPSALAASLRAFAVDEALDPAKRDLFVNWLTGNTTGDALIRAGVPDGWVVGDKTGAASYGTRNDIAVLWPPDGDPIVLAVLSSRMTADAAYDDALLAVAAKITIDALN